MLYSWSRVAHEVIYRVAVCWPWWMSFSGKHDEKTGDSSGREGGKTWENSFPQMCTMRLARCKNSWCSSHPCCTCACTCYNFTHDLNCHACNTYCILTATAVAIRSTVVLRTAVEPHGWLCNPCPTHCDEEGIFHAVSNALCNPDKVFGNP